VNPTDAAGNLFCTGYHFEGNTFTKNFGCPRYGGAVIKMECLDTTDSSSQANDQITGLGLTSAYQSSWYYSSATYTPALFGAQSYSYTGAGTGTDSVLHTVRSVNPDLKRVTFKSNVFSYNAATAANGIVNIEGFPRVQFDTETF
jgi:hypothetical protein